MALINYGGIKVMCANALTISRCTFLRIIGSHIEKCHIILEPYVIFILLCRNTPKTRLYQKETDMKDLQPHESDIIQNHTCTDFEDRQPS